jgi:hypothetical protein
VVDYATAARGGEPYAAGAAKYGLPNQSWQWCTSQLKGKPLDTFSAAVFGTPKGAHHTAVGIRADEIDRVSELALQRGFIYPLADLGITKQDVLQWCAAQSFDLQVPAHQGNCTWCWKKSDRTLFHVAKETPEAFAFPQMLEDNFATVGPDIAKGTVPRRYIWRGKRTTAELLAQAHAYHSGAPRPKAEKQLPVADAGTTAAVPNRSYSAAQWARTRKPKWRVLPNESELDLAGGCGDSCEVGADTDSAVDWDAADGNVTS